MNDEDALVASALVWFFRKSLAAVEGIVNRLKNGGRLFYIGTGTSGRLGVLDAAECPPTFGVSPDLVQAVIAGGYEACYRAVEASEDDATAGERDLAARGFSKGDVLVGIAASGSTPYTVGAVKYARSLGAFTVAITCVPGFADHRSGRSQYCSGCWSGSDCRFDSTQSRYRAKDGSQHVVNGDDGQARLRDRKSDDKRAAAQ